MDAQKTMLLDYIIIHFNTVTDEYIIEKMREFGVAMPPNYTGSYSQYCEHTLLKWMNNRGTVSNIHASN